MLRLGENHFWFALASSDALLYAMGLAANLGWDVQLGEPDVSPVQIQGPRSKDVVAALFGDDILSLRYYWFRELSLDGIPVVVTRTGWTAEVGYEIYLRDGQYGTALWERIMEAGRPFQIRPTGPVDIRRVEGGILNWGADMTTEHNPYEVGLERLCNLDGDFEFMGKAALRQVRETGVRRRLVGVEIDGDRLEMNFTKWPMHADGAPVGEVTTALWSPRLERNIGYAWLPTERADNGNRARVTTPDGERDATVVPMPFIDPLKEIPKS
jgi:aminomethyltransferase